MQIIERNPGELVPYARNAKLHPPEQVEHIANSIRRYGFKQPLVIDKDGVVIVGHGRLLAAKRLGLDSVPCVLADDLNADEVKAYRLADNKTNESDWDIELLTDELGEIEIDMDEFGFGDEVETEKEKGEAEQARMNEVFQIIIDCENEIDLQEKYEQIRSAGIECRISTL